MQLISEPSDRNLSCEFRGQQQQSDTCESSHQSRIPRAFQDYLLVAACFAFYNFNVN